MSPTKLALAGLAGPLVALPLAWSIAIKPGQVLAIWGAIFVAIAELAFGLKGWDVVHYGAILGVVIMLVPVACVVAARPLPTRVSATFVALTYVNLGLGLLILLGLHT